MKKKYKVTVSIERVETFDVYVESENEAGARQLGIGKALHGDGHSVSHETIDVSCDDVVELEEEKAG